MQVVRRRFSKLALCLAATIACSSARHPSPQSSAAPATGNGGTTVESAAGSAPDQTGGAPAARTGTAGARLPNSSSGGASVQPPPRTGDAGVADAGANARDASAGAIDPSFADCMDEMQTTPTSGSTPYPGGTWTVPDAKYGTTIESAVEIVMSDGVKLVGDVSYPADLMTGARASGEFPVLLTQNPYGPALFGPDYGAIFVTHGYIFATVDVRGTSRSGGDYDLFGPREAQDGAELVSWAAMLAGSDGSVGLQGCSQLGINQLETATLLGPGSPVKAMIPACPSGDFYRDTAFDNGVPSVTALALVPDAAMGADTAYYRDYWKMRDRVARAPAIARTGIPALLWSGWHEPGALGSLELYTVLQNVAAGRSASTPIVAGDAVSGKYQVIIGDWGHGGGLDLGIELQWYDTWIKGIDTGLATKTKTPLHLAELGGTKRWINARCYPLVASYTPFFLASNGVLSRSGDGSEAQDELMWVSQDSAADSVEYASEPFADGAMLAGPLAAQLHVTSSNTNLQLFIELFDRAADGTLQKIGFGSSIGTLRGTDPAKSWADPSGLPTRPYLALDADQALAAGEQAQLDVPLGPTVWSIEPMHSVVARISSHPSSDDCLGVIVPPVGCYPTDPMLTSLAGGIYKIQLGGKQGSLISLPLLEHGAFSSVANVSSPTGTTDYPLPVVW